MCGEPALGPVLRCAIRIARMLTDGDTARARQRLLRMHFESGVGHIGVAFTNTD